MGKDDEYADARFQLAEKAYPSGPYRFEVIPGVTGLRLALDSSKFLPDQVLLSSPLVSLEVILQHVNARRYLNDLDFWIARELRCQMQIYSVPSELCAWQQCLASLALRPLLLVYDR